MPFYLSKIAYFLASAFYSATNVTHAKGIISENKRDECF